VKPIFEVKDTLVKSVYYITYYTICHFVVLFSNICNSSWENMNRIKICKLSEMGNKQKKKMSLRFGKCGLLV